MNKKHDSTPKRNHPRQSDRTWEIPFELQPDLSESELIRALSPLNPLGDSAVGISANCDRFEELLRKERDLTDDEVEEILLHCASCPTGRHSRSGVERELGLSPGDLVKGSPRHGLLSQDQRLALLAEMIQAELDDEARSEGEGPSQIPEPVCPLEEALDRSLSTRPTQRVQLLLDRLEPVRYWREQSAGLARNGSFLGKHSTSLAVAFDLEPAPGAPVPVKVVSSNDLAAISPIRGLYRQEGSVTWLSGMFRLDLGFAKECETPPASTVLLWRLFRHWESFAPLPAEEMLLLLLQGDMEWEDACTGEVRRLSADSGDNVLWTTAGEYPVPGSPPSLPPFRVRQVGDNEAIGLVILYSSEGLKFQTARDGRQIRFTSADQIRHHPRLDRWRWPGTRNLILDRIPRKAEELSSLLFNARARGDRHDPARHARQFVDLDLPGLASCRNRNSNLQVRLAKFYAGKSRSRNEILMAEHPGLELIVPLVGSVDLFCGDLEQLRGAKVEKQVWSLGDFERCVHQTAQSARTLGSRFSDLLLLRSCYPHALQGQDGDSICLHIRCPSR